MISFLIKILFYIAVLAIIAGFLRTWMVEWGENQKMFLKGVVPNPLLDGLYNGLVERFETNWVGKKFDAKNSTGINLFAEGGERYPFKTSVGEATRDKGLSVLKIDYNISGNPFWARFILDEVVETAPGEYLGKLEVRIFPNYSFALGFFKLKK